MSSFSERHGRDIPDAEISIRHEAPAWLRDLLVDYAYEVGFRPTDLRSILCKKLLVAPDSNNWSEFPNIDCEVRMLMADAPWFYVYDLIETLYAQKAGVIGSWNPNGDAAAKFLENVNRLFRKKGVGWQLKDGAIQIRGPEIFENTLQTAVDAAQQTGRSVASNELREALHDLSRRPSPELTGAIQHAMAALECVARDITHDPKVTLGEWLKKNPQAFPPPLGSAVEKLWGYASEYGRHVREGRPPTFEDAEMAVSVAGALATYLMRKP